MDMKFGIIGLILSVFLSACNNSKEQVDRQAVMHEMEQREIKRVLPGEIMEAAYMQGDTIATRAQQQLLEQYSVSSASGLAELLQAQADVYADSLEKRYRADIHWISLGDTLSNQISSLEEQILKAYQYNVEHQLELTHNVQRIDEESYLYTKPVLLNEHLRKELKMQQQSVSDSIRFLGMWSITLSKKEIIQNM